QELVAYLAAVDLFIDEHLRQRLAQRLGLRAGGRAHRSPCSTGLLRYDARPEHKSHKRDLSLTRDDPERAHAPPAVRGTDIEVKSMRRARCRRIDLDTILLGDNFKVSFGNNLQRDFARKVYLTRGFGRGGVECTTNQLARDTDLDGRGVFQNDALIH